MDISPEVNAALIQVAGLWSIEQAKNEQEPVDGKVYIDDEELLKKIRIYHQMLVQEFSRQN